MPELTLDEKIFDLKFMHRQNLKIIDLIKQQNKLLSEQLDSLLLKKMEKEGDPENEA